MARLRWVRFTMVGVLALAIGCGIADDDFQAGNRLLVLSITDGDGSATPVLNANEQTDDSGEDGEANTDDNGENNGRPDAGELLLAPITSDPVTMTLGNETRPGVEEGVELSVYRIDVTYLDANGNSQDFAPTQNHFVSESVAPDSTTSLEFVLIPAAMKFDGLRDIFLFGTDAERQAVRTWTAFVDVYARDQLNDDNVHTQANVSITFVNPMVAE